MSGLSQQIGKNQGNLHEWHSLAGMHHSVHHLISSGWSRSNCMASNKIHHCNCKNFEWPVTEKSCCQPPLNVFPMQRSTTKCFPHAEIRKQCRDAGKPNSASNCSFFIRRVGKRIQNWIRAIIPRTKVVKGCETWSSAQDDNKVITAHVFEPNYLSI